MEKRVIKFSLVGAIFVLLLIIGAIAGIVVGVNSSKKGKDNNDKSIENNQEKIEQKKQEPLDENKEYTELISVGDEEKEIKMKICKGTFGYVMKYDINEFYVDKNVEGKDEYYSLTSDTIYINITKKDADFEDEVNDLILDSSRQEEGVGYEIIQTEINGKNTYKETIKNETENITNYYIDAEDGVFIIEIHCGNGFTDLVMPVIEKMVESFEKI